ncbi:MAG: hypothetical protein Q4G68_13720 [Planctomycetia bacterium]|nr:hypothetical protein [Planctomycetia bacterium]
MRILLCLFMFATTLKADEYQSAREILRQLGVEQIVFVKRFTYTASNYYAEHVNSDFLPGGNICVLDLASGRITELCPSLREGVFERFDLDFDAEKIVFSWKSSLDEGYRLYEVGLGGENLHPVLPPPNNEKRLVKLYSDRYRHGTDDLSPCYLPDGDICFTSSRCQYGITCDAPDTLTTTVLYRCAVDGANLRKLSNSAVSESSPVCMKDGRILYTRWEYVDKGSACIKALWAMHPDGTGTEEIFGNNVALPPTIQHGREIPSEAGQFVFTGGPHSPYTAMGPIGIVNTRCDIRTESRIKWITPYVQIREEVGWDFWDQDTHQWYTDRAGCGPLFKEAFPLTEDLFLVAHKPQGPPCNAPNGYGIYLLDASGTVRPVYTDAEISCWNPIPVKKRPRPPILPHVTDQELAGRGLAQMMVMNVYQGLDGVAPGEIKYLRILEQVPRPWSARRWDFDDEYGQQHAVITKATHLVLKVLHGIVPVEADGSANFYVPSEANIFLQALDKNYAAIQTERTYVHSMPGEVRTCMGCHEKKPDAYDISAARLVAAMQRDPSFPVPQPGDPFPQRVIDYVLDVQPIWDKHCMPCHGPEESQGGLRLDGEKTRLFNVSYEQLVPDRYEPENFPDHDLVGKTIGEHHPKTGNAEYLPPKTLGSYSSVLAAALSDGKIVLQEPGQQSRVEQWRLKHPDIALSTEERVRFTTWIDTNCQYYGSWFGRRNIKYEGRRDFRPSPEFSGKSW